MTILVTGAGGFLGGHVCAELAAKGRPLRGLDLHWPGERPEDHVTGSILDEAVLARAGGDVSAIIHCAAIAELWTRDLRDYDMINVVGTCRLAGLARQRRARMVHVSSYTTLIGRNPPALLDEAAEVPPSLLLGPYPRSKRQAELAALAANAAGAEVIAVLPTAPVGPGDHNLTPPGRMVCDLAKGSLPALIDCQLDLVDIRTLARGVIAALDRGRAGERYLLSGQGLTLATLARDIAALTGVPAPKWRVPMGVALLSARVEAVLSRITGRAPRAPLTGVRLAARRVGFSSARAIEELGYNPAPPDLPATLDWFRAAGHL